MKKNKKALVTIITPTYKRLPSLKEAVNCVLNQTYKHWEHIIVADGHQPKVEKFVKNLNDDRIKYLFTERTNFVGNFQRNYGLKYATGKYILFLDDDNLVDKNYLAEMMKGFNSEEIGYVICHIKDYERNKIFKPKFPFVYGEIDTLNFVVKKDLIEKVGRWPGRKYLEKGEKRDNSDFCLINKVSKISKGNFINKVLGEYRRIPSGHKSRISHYYFLKGQSIKKTNRLKAFYYYLKALYYDYERDYLRAIKELFVKYNN